MDINFNKGFARLLSYISAFTYGIYAYASTHGDPIELHRWVITGGVGIMFFIISLPDKK